METYTERIMALDHDDQEKLHRDAENILLEALQATGDPELISLVGAFMVLRKKPGLWYS